jgi:hypothetical protein
MPLYQIKDDDRPMFVQAKTYALAIAKWEQYVTEENATDVGPPTYGIVFICDDDDLLIDADLPG